MTAALKNAIMTLKGYPYHTDSGDIVKAIPVSQIASELRDAGWRRVPRLDYIDVRSMGIRVVEARYQSWGGMKRRCMVAVVG